MPKQVYEGSRRVLDVGPDDVRIGELVEVLSASHPKYVGLILVKTYNSWVTVYSESVDSPAFETVWCGDGLRSARFRVLEPSETVTLSNEAD